MLFRSTLTGADGTYTGPNARNGDGVYRAKDVDLYQFQATAGQALTATIKLPAGGTGTYGYLNIFDKDGIRLYANYWYNFYGSQVVTQDFAFTTTGTYYVGVSGYYNALYDPKVGGSGYAAYYTGDYNLTLKLKTPAPDTAGDTLTDALATGFGPTAGTSTTYTGHIGDGLYKYNDVDLYKFQATAGQALTATIGLPAGVREPTAT